MYRIGVCDDDLAFGIQLEQYIQNFAKLHKIQMDIFVFTNGEEYLKFLKEKSPVNLLFLDIRFGKSLDGIQVGKELRSDMKNEMTQIVYISGLESYAMRLFQNRPMDFLIKPVTQERIDQILDEYIQLFGDRKTQYFEYNIGKDRYRIMEDEIRYFECIGRKIKMTLENETEIDFYGNMDDVKEHVSDEKFWRIHKSYLVNRKSIEIFRASEVCLISGETLPISRSCKEKIQKKLLEERIGKRV